MLLQLLGIGDFGGGKLAHGRDVFLDASLFKAGSGKVLRSTDEDSRASLDG